MATQGGYRKPENPAPVSGPGALSQRTDGGPAQGAKYISGLPYGEGQATYDQQTAAPMAAKEQAPQMPEVTSLMAESSRPSEAITSGINIGEGPGSEIMKRPNQVRSLTDIIRDIVQYDASGDSELIYRALIDEGY